MNIRPIIITALSICAMGGNTTALALPLSELGRAFYTPYTITQTKSAYLVAVPGVTDHQFVEADPDIIHTVGDTYVSDKASLTITGTGHGIVGPAIKGQASTHTVTATGILHTVTKDGIVGEQSHSQSITQIAKCPVAYCPEVRVNFTKTEKFELPPLEAHVSGADLFLDYQVVGSFPASTVASATFTLTKESTYLNSGLMKKVYAAKSDDLSLASKALKVVGAIVAPARRLADLVGIALDTFHDKVSDYLVTRKKPELLASLTITAISALITGGLILAAAAGASTAAIAVAAAIAVVGTGLTIGDTVYKAWAADPPDHEYSEAIVVDLAAIPQLELGDSEVAQESEILVNNLMLHILLEAAALDFYEKYQGALLDELVLGMDTLAFQELQKTQMLGFLGQSELAMQLAASAADKLGTLPEVASDPELRDATRLVSRTLAAPTNQVPEPSSIALFILGLISLFAASKKSGVFPCNMFSLKNTPIPPIYPHCESKVPGSN